MKTKMTSRMTATILSVLAGGAMTVPFMQAATAAPEPSRGPVEVKLTAYKVVAHGEKETLQSAEKMKPGEIIEYQARYANTSEQAVRNLMATLPIPSALELLTGTIAPVGALVSTDGKNFAAPPLKRFTKLSNGGTSVEFVPAIEYRFVRWNVGDLGAGKSIAVSARARVIGPVKNAATTVTSAVATKGGAH